MSGWLWAMRHPAQAWGAREYRRKFGRNAPSRADVYRLRVEAQAPDTITDWAVRREDALPDGCDGRTCHEDGGEWSHEVGGCALARTEAEFLAALKPELREVAEDAMRRAK